MTDEDLRPTGPMRVRCACGWEATGSEDELIAAATDHGARRHNMTPTRKEVLAMIVPSRTTEQAAGDG
jgi:predicted small metal-binding protein